MVDSANVNLITQFMYKVEELEQIFKGAGVNSLEVLDKVEGRVGG